jgi:hypothetical protein
VHKISLFQRIYIIIIKQAFFFCFIPLLPLNIKGNGVVDQVLEADGRRNERKALQWRERQRE